jgi:copper transport protein
LLIVIHMGMVLFGLNVDGVSAHAELIEAEPVPGALLAGAPTEIRLTFNESVAAQSTIAVLGEGFAPVEPLEPQLSPGRPQQLYTTLPPLEPGTYTVQWSAVSGDGHEISGSYSFSIGQGSETISTAEQTSPEHTTITNIIWWLFALLAVVLLILFTFFWYRRTGRGAG